MHLSAKLVDLHMGADFGGAMKGLARRDVSLCRHPLPDASDMCGCYTHYGLHHAGGQAPLVERGGKASEPHQTGADLCCDRLSTPITVLLSMVPLTCSHRHGAGLHLKAYCCYQALALRTLTLCLHIDVCTSAQVAPRRLPLHLHDQHSIV